ncbi:hypothetical protein DDZ16_16600 [Marinilabilia rubra]|uniref:Uncharacterized protein n=1 Tax=Marinilabilia rubra TaxID=2162893 RepID=A0A2U2B594_9BACT|nr:hypothetical protein DDZ16_16600 [Marinilabilia rubra]
METGHSVSYEISQVRRIPICRYEKADSFGESGRAELKKLPALKEPNPLRMRVVPAPRGTLP